MATSRATISSVLATVTAAADSVSALVNTTTKSIGMLDAFVTKAANEQTVKHKADALSFKKNVLRDYAQLEADANLKVVEFCKKSDNHKSLYETAYNELASALDPATT